MDRASMLALVDKFGADLSTLQNNIQSGIASIKLDLTNFRSAVDALPAQSLTEADLFALADRLRPTLIAAAETLLGITPETPSHTNLPEPEPVISTMSVPWEYVRDERGIINGTRALPDVVVPPESPPSREESDPAGVSSPKPATAPESPENTGPADTATGATPAAE